MNSSLWAFFGSYGWYFWAKFEGCRAAEPTLLSNWGTHLLSGSSFSKTVKAITPSHSTGKLRRDHFPAVETFTPFYYFTYKMPDLNWDVSIVQIKSDS